MKNYAKHISQVLLCILALLIMICCQRNSEAWEKMDIAEHIMNMQPDSALSFLNSIETDNLFLDGKRLILISGMPCQEGALYCIEGDPYTKVTAHGQYSTSNATTWFEVRTTDGMTYQYGNTSDSRLTFLNNSGNQRIASWHINRTEDLKGNYMTVSYW